MEVAICIGDIFKCLALRMPILALPKDDPLEVKGVMGDKPFGKWSRASAQGSALKVDHNWGWKPCSEGILITPCHVPANIPELTKYSCLQVGSSRIHSHHVFLKIIMERIEVHKGMGGLIFQTECFGESPLEVVP